MLTENSVGTRRSATLATGRNAGRRGSRIKARFLIAGLVIVAAIGYMIYAAIQSGSEYFVTTGELKAMGAKAIDQPTKLGGRVVQGSVRRDKGANTISFSLTDGNQTLPVTYAGVVPDSFQEGVDVIVEGKLGADGSFQATTLMAKCASKYVPANSQ
jgi:cytochrome c-type biogenesis protein CcmE